MEVGGIYIGGWFQRTTLQLSEVYDFLKYKTSRLKLDKNKLVRLWDNLDINNNIGAHYKIEGLEYLTYSTNSGFNIKIFEDGLITLRLDDKKDLDVFKETELIANYYENNISPAINYLFSLGAPVPKELANIKSVYPYFIVLNNATKKDIDLLIEQTENQRYFDYTSDKFDIERGDIYYFINNKKGSPTEIERYIEEQIFIREFKAQLHHYLNLHRTIWEKIADVKEHANITGKEIIKYSNKIDGYSKTVNLIEGRIRQMNSYLKTRERLAKEDNSLKEALDLIGYRYETLGNTLSYIKDLWDMTSNYVNSASRLFNNLKGDITNQSLDNLTIVTSMGVGASLIGLFTESEPSFSLFGIFYFFALALVGLVVNKIMSTVASKRKYEINDIEYDKNIK